MNNLVTWLVPALISSVFGFLTALATTSYKLRKQINIEKEKENERIRLRYLNPLLISSMDLLERIVDIKRRINNKKIKKIISWFEEIKKNERKNKSEFAYWANDEGYFAMSTLYVTSVYFCYASKIRREFPYIELKPGDDKALLFFLSEVRIAIGGKFGIWETIQDSLGSYLINRNDNSIKNYREFCDSILDQTEYLWFNRLIDFYKDIDKKLPDHLNNIESSLKNLIEFLTVNLKIRTIEFKITHATLKKLKEKGIPESIVKKLEEIESINYTSQVDFVDALVATIGQDETDDYKPSILKYAVRK